MGGYPKILNKSKILNLYVKNNNSLRFCYKKSQKYKKSQNQKIRIYLIIRTNAGGVHKNRIRAERQAGTPRNIHCSHDQNEIIHGNLVIIQFDKEDLD